ncbi:hypothetical protein DK562_21835 [Salmonella enterica]|nr:hypothetical protein [Salmonella enterica]EBV8440973.1 hypothetical protein [Salmonella enterica subsp. enterica serovar Chester]EBX8913804.1 hypothetical protein [Salmonella enterica subsp. enterica serovar Agoueve]ECI4210188.1 hypothetical protein [Salmonella enterica subsp. enterica]EBK4003644.1 hypothetical protein [Salmonella enterica]
MCSEKKTLNADAGIDMDRCEKSEVLCENKNKVVRQFDCCKRIALTSGELNDWQHLAASLNGRVDG